LKKLVLDANTLASGIADPASKRPPRLLFDALKAIAFEPIICPKLLEELRKALRKPYFRERISAEETRTCSTTRGIWNRRRSAPARLANCSV
jgi:predicted nucleic acid-binding protein